VDYSKAPQGYIASDENPFSNDGRYGPDWTGFIILDREDDYGFMGQSKSGLFHYSFSRSRAHIEQMLADYLRYEAAHDRKTILSFPPDIDVDDFVRMALDSTPDSKVVRDSDPEYVVHSTTAYGAKQIFKDGELKSMSALGREGKGMASLAVELGEPSEYSEYICFAPIRSSGPEIVVASNQKGRFVDENEPYEPGARFYFDAYSLIQSGLITRVIGDIKVRNRLPLKPYLLYTVSFDKTGPGQNVKKWTPKTFTEASDAFFLSEVK
jgi:hypothetical protein